MKLLTGKNIYCEKNNWYAPICEFIEKHPSVVFSKYTNQTSSAGDWEGFIIQKTGKNVAHAIAFYQENAYPNAGFHFHTAEKPFLMTKSFGDGKQFIADAESCVNQFYEE
jgi:hypothetical protein